MVRFPQAKTFGVDISYKIVSESVWGFASECFVVDHTEKKGFRSYAAGLVSLDPSFAQRIVSWGLAVAEVRGE